MEEKDQKTNEKTEESTARESTTGGPVSGGDDPRDDGDS